MSNPQKENIHSSYVPTPTRRGYSFSILVVVSMVFGVGVAAAIFGPEAAVVAILMAILGVALSRAMIGSLNESLGGPTEATFRSLEIAMDAPASANTPYVLKQTDKYFRTSFEAAPCGMAIVSPTKQFLLVNQALAEVFGCTIDDLMDTGLLAQVAREDTDSIEINLGRLLDGTDRTFQTETRIKRMDGDVRWLRMSVSVVSGILNVPFHFVIQFEDVTERRIAEERRVHNTLHDELSGLPNRHLFLDRLQMTVNRALREPGSRLSVLYVDFDRFKFINDNFNQQIADKMLKQAGERLIKLLPQTNTVARLGGDEFAILLEDRTFEEVLEAVMQIRQELSLPYYLNNEQIYTTVSVGVAIGSQVYESAEILLRDAATALKQAKLSGRDRYEIFVEEMHSNSVQFLQLEADLRLALERNELRVVYQPIVTLSTGILAGFESLIRWEHPVRGTISPVEFIPIAEESGMIVQIGEWIMRESCKQLCKWKEASERSADLWVSVNVSSKQFFEADLVTTVSNVLADSGLEPRFLKLEITESTMAEDIEYVTATMELLKEMGVKLSIDDFGTGFSSLSVLDRLPLDSLKIDRSFVSQIKTADTVVEMVRTIVNLAKSLDLEIIAEGVETIQQLSQLRQLGCQFGQGYCFATPLDVYTLDELLGADGASSEFFYLLPADLPDHESDDYDQPNILEIPESIDTLNRF